MLYIAARGLSSGIPTGIKAAGSVSFIKPPMQDCMVNIGIIVIIAYYNIHIYLYPTK